ncbi:hypothetical protein AMAG_08237 [Allomyces macrogynus ATCC 38327]|uniref:Uncharacterized protein n=1 Tax=Allomyces macrogynus (strain ATCC 38327) TaxID=578462 RepID=A0A0L0SKJ9_ALLM3|nr:hypothetical protein AMAG_08237 [Allomyces macrogynus ATCC 38327]|eukprot:KNE63071.1 hypothetical protein AMAG_08237 [Allomyces macrogynus ATCC 38327]
MRALACAIAARPALLACTTRAATAPHPIRALATARPTPNPAPAATASSQTNPATGEPYMDLDATSNRGYGTATINADVTATKDAETRPSHADTGSSASAKSTAELYSEDHAEPVGPTDPRRGIDVEEANAAAMDHPDGPDIDQDGTFQNPAAFSDG